MKIESFIFGPADTNAYLIYVDRQGVVIDPGLSPYKLLQRIHELSLDIKAILITHAHFDHIGGLEETRKVTQAPVYIHCDEQDWLSDPILNGSREWPGISDVVCQEAEFTLNGGELLQIAGLEFKVLSTPGHSPGSLSYVLQNNIFSGDILFLDAIGNTNKPGRSHKALINSIYKHVMTMPSTTKIFPGHGPSTTVEREKDKIPF